MINFMLGTVAGGIIACILTITAARHATVQRPMLVPMALAAATPAALNQCPPKEGLDQKMAGATKLFEPRRFWFVAP